ncbi:MAG: ABC transporter ATP-binding protein [Solirubrobacterales bacterium]|nr:ABC transporter ATP-binding protein [Solirubrobacterales bacterium]MBV9943442.1 ABC transporter ATP-binding protein [Solirubrobacterales bacterium]
MNNLKRKQLSDLEAPERRVQLRSIDGLGERAGLAAVEVAELRKTYPGGVEAVKGISFAVAPGEVFGLLGPNGAGKSTTIGMLTTTVVPTSGTARLAGYDVAEQPLLARGVSSVVFQDSVVDGPLSGRANLELHARLWGVPAVHAGHRITELVDAVGLTELIGRPVSSYSGGQRRRLEIARALVSSPRVLFLDEPTVGLDPRIRHELLDVIAGLRAREEMTIVLTTHYLDEAQRLCDRVAIIHEGTIVALDSPGALLAGLGREILEFRVSGSPEAALSALRDRGAAGDDAFAVGARVTVPLHGHAARDALAAIEAERLRASELATRVPTLDDVYLHLTGERIAHAG